MVAMDADFLSLLLHPNPRAPLDPKTKHPVERVKQRIESLIASLEKARDKIVIPAPALSEVLALALDKASEFLAEITSNYGFDVAAFDEVAAVEAAIATAEAKQRGNKKSGSTGTWAKVKFDRQIVAIAKVKSVSTIYSNDEDIRKLAEREGIKVVSVWELPEPPAEQISLLEGQ
jgi:predicted nucleic acid-binding protein